MMTLFDLDELDEPVVPSYGTNIGPIVIISARDDHARAPFRSDPSAGTGGKPA
jgi:hypothetical protein